MRKHKKFITRSVLVLILISTLLGTFTIFSSAYNSSDAPWFYCNRNQVDLSMVQYPGTPLSFYPTPNELRKPNLMLHLDDSMRIYFSAFAHYFPTNPWFILPVASRNGEGTFQDQIELLNNSDGVITNSSNYEWINTVASFATASFEAINLKLPVFDDTSNYSSQLQIEPKASVWFPSSYDWYPVFQIGASFDVLRLGPGGTDYIIQPARFKSSFYSLPTYSTNLLQSVNNGFDFFSSGYISRLPYNSAVTSIFCMNVPLTDSFGDSIVGGQIQCGCMFYDKSSVFNSDGTKKPMSQWTVYDSSIQNNYLWSDGLYFVNDRAIRNTVSAAELSSSVSNAYTDGYNKGEQGGYNRGYSEGVKASENYNAVDGIIALAQVPGTFISSMLDFNVFGINLATTVKVIFTVLIVAFIIVIMLKFLL